ncbi:MAG: hypothetical protein ABIQ97_00160 [Lysobacteraceae bacterium]
MRGASAKDAAASGFVAVCGLVAGFDGAALVADAAIANISIPPNFQLARALMGVSRLNPSVAQCAGSRNVPEVRSPGDQTHDDLIGVFADAKDLPQRLTAAIDASG